MGVSSIKFTQGVTTAPAGQALLGAVGSPVVASNGNDANIVEWTYEWIDTGSGTSAIPIGVVQDGGLPTYTFTPDTSGCYLLHLTTRDKAGVVAEDYRVFGVVETSGRLIPSFAATASAMNFGGQTKGWAPYVDAYLRQVDAGGGGSFTAGGDLSGTSTSQQVKSVTGVAGTLAIAATAAIFAWAAAASAPTLKQADLTTNSGTGQALTVQAQNATGTTSVGGDLVLQSGTGTSTPGTLRLKVGSGTIGQLGAASTDSLTLGAAASGQSILAPLSLQFSSGAPSGLIGQFSTSTTNATGATLSITAQGVTGTGTTTSGSLAFSSGVNTGSTTGNVGNINFTTPTPVGAGTYGGFTFTPGSGQSLTISKLSGLTGVQIAVSGTYLYIGDGTNTVVNLTAAGGPGIQIGGSGAYMNDAGSFGIQFTYNTTAMSQIMSAVGTSYTLGFQNSTTASGTGAPFTLAAQSNTGTTSIGGDLFLSSGTGTSTNGNVHLQVGAADLLTLGAYGSGKGVLGLASAGTAPTTASSTLDILWADAVGLHCAPLNATSANFLDYMIAPVLQGTPNTQAMKVRQYAGVARTTTSASVNGPTIPIPTGSVVVIQTTYSGRDVTSGTVGDGFSKVVLTQFKNVAGTVTGAATNSVSLGVVNDTSMASCAVGFTISGTNVILQVAGLTSVTIDWTIVAEVVVT